MPILKHDDDELADKAVLECRRCLKQGYRRKCCQEYYCNDCYCEYLTPPTASLDRWLRGAADHATHALYACTQS